MAGRPKKMAERVTALEEHALCVELDMFLEIPRMYFEQPNDTPLCVAWNEAIEAVCLAHLAMEKLGEMLRKKAKITEPGPYEKMMLKGGDTYKPVTEDWSFSRACIGAAKSRQQHQAEAQDTQPVGACNAVISPTDGHLDCKRMPVGRRTGVNSKLNSNVHDNGPLSDQRF